MSLERLITIAISLAITATITLSMNFHFENTTINNYDTLNKTINYKFDSLENSSELSDKQQIAYLKQILKEVR
jgi:hypothetical protein